MRCQHAIRPSRLPTRCSTEAAARRAMGEQARPLRTHTRRSASGHPCASRAPSTSPLRNQPQRQRQLQTQPQPQPPIAHYKYLGADVLSPIDDIKQHVQKAWVVLRKFRAIWRSDVDIDTKRALFQASVAPIFRYGLHAYESSVALTTRITGAYTRMMRYALNATFNGKEWSIHSEALLGPHLPIATQLVRARLSVVGHCLRAHASGKRHPFCSVLLWEPKFPRKSGGQYSTLRKSIFKEARVRTSEELFELAMSRQRWKGVCDAAESCATTRFYDRLRRSRIRSSAGLTES